MLVNQQNLYKVCGDPAIFEIHTPINVLIYLESSKVI